MFNPAHKCLDTSSAVAESHPEGQARLDAALRQCNHMDARTTTIRQFIKPLSLVQGHDPVASGLRVRTLLTLTSSFRCIGHHRSPAVSG